MKLFNFLSKQQSNSVLGLDIGTTSMKMVEVVKGGQVPQLVNYGMLETKSSVARANTALQTSSLKLFEKEAGEFLKLLIDRMQPRTKNAIASLPLFSAFTTVLSLPSMGSA